MAFDEGGPSQVGHLRRDRLCASNSTQAAGVGHFLHRRSSWSDPESFPDDVYNCFVIGVARSPVIMLDEAGGRDPSRRLI
ncbi:hypothetical protein EVAR_54895_1 [Eumeta japonica]|uniref:Uncharacterized protein n=1 Tax=Eumeta variegata TaxID=151549 RepID=A0A4C1ZWP9_EUMVA|nr:hypothetical protein EVAR_54895_1 [Eumeta japonica]